MATPYIAIQKSFHSRLTSKVPIISELEEQYLLDALGEFELQLYPITYVFGEQQIEQEGENGEDVQENQLFHNKSVTTFDSEDEYIFGEIVENLTRAEISLLGALMYKQYLSQQIDEVLQLHNIVGKDISITGVGQSKQVYISRYNKLDSEIKGFINGLKNNTYDIDD